MPSVRHYLGAQHILSAAIFCREAFGIEGSAPKDPPGELFTRHRAYVIGAVFAAVAFLEGTINQLFQDAHDDNLGYLKGLDARAIQAMAAMWGHGVPRTARYPVLKKFEIALTLAGKPPLPSGGPAENAAALVTLRNALTHYEPEWIKGDAIRAPADKPHKLETHLRGRFAENPLTSKGNPFYPDKALGHRCAEWAVTSALAYADAAHSALGLKPMYDAMRMAFATR